MTIDSQIKSRQDKSSTRVKTPGMRSIIKNLAVGEVYPFPVSKASVIRSTASALGLELRREYSTAVHRDIQTIAVKRLS